MANKNARQLRKTMTDAEKRLWSVLRNRQLGDCKFRRQRPIGKYIVDFVCMERQLIVEADGGQHNESESDQKRTAWFESNGWSVIRFWNNDILKNLEGVRHRILEALKCDTLTPAPLPSGEREGPVAPQRQRRPTGG